MSFPPYTPYPVQFTSVAEIERVFSHIGKTLHLDDLDPLSSRYESGTDPEATDDNYITELIDRVTARVMEHLAPRYEAEDIADHPRIREIATYWACHELSKRRGNEPLFEPEYLEGLETLDRYRDGTLFLDAPQKMPRVAVQSYVVDNRSFIRPVRVITGASTFVASGQRRFYEYPFFWI